MHWHESSHVCFILSGVLISWRRVACFTQNAPINLIPAVSEARSCYHGVSDIGIQGWKLLVGCWVEFRIVWALCLFTVERSDWTYWYQLDLSHSALAVKSQCFPHCSLCAAALRRKSSPVSPSPVRQKRCACLSLLLITGPSAEQHAHTLPLSDGTPSGCH